MIFKAGASFIEKFVSCPAGDHNCGQLGGHIFFFFFFFPLYRNDVENDGKKDRNDVENDGKKEKYQRCEKCTYLALKSSPRRWTGNRIILKDGLMNLEK